jgi:hypothetical protein
VGLEKMSDLLVADKFGNVVRSDTMVHKKAPAPMVGERHGLWAGRDDAIQALKLPGGGMLMFDLDRLTLDDFRSMRNHYQVHISLMILTFLMHQIDWKIECDDQRIADHCTENLHEIWTRLVRGMSQAFWAGYSPMVLQYENDVEGRRVLLDKVKDLVPEECTINWKKVNGYAPPGHQPPKHMVYDGIKQQGSSWPIPVENTLWYPLLMENGDHYGRKLLKPAFPPWFFSQLIHLFSNRYFERFGEPTPIGRAPVEDSVTINGVVKTGHEVMEGVLRNLRNRSVVVLPNERDTTTNGARNWEWDIEYLESQMRGADFERYMQRLDEEISLALFTPVLLYRTADVGSYNLGEAHYRLFMSMLNALAGDIKEYIDKYVLNRMVDFNFSPNSPRARWHPRKMGKDTSEILRAMANALITQKIAMPDLEELGVAIGMSMQQIEAVQSEVAMAELDAQIAADAAEQAAALAPKVVTAPAGAGAGGNTSANAKPIIAKMFKRAQTQIEKAKRDGSQLSTLDLGHRRQLAEVVGDQTADGFADRFTRWWDDLLTVADDLEAAELTSMVGKVLDAELASL